MATDLLKEVQELTMAAFRAKLQKEADDVVTTRKYALEVEYPLAAEEIREAARTGRRAMIFNVRDGDGLPPARGRADVLAELLACDGFDAKPDVARFGGHQVNVCWAHVTQQV